MSADLETSQSYSSLVDALYPKSGSTPTAAQPAADKDESQASKSTDSDNAPRKSLADFLYPKDQQADDFAGLKSPEGFDSTYMPKMVELAKAYDIKPEKAQKLLDETHARMIRDRQTEEATKAKNMEVIRADKDYGGEKTQASLMRAQQIVDKLEAHVPGLKAKLNGSMTDPVLVRAFNVLGDGVLGS